VIDASTFNQNRRRRFEDGRIEQAIFDRIVEQAIEHGLIGGEALFADSTHLKANANKRRHTVHEVVVKPVDYLSELEAAVDEDRSVRASPR
jgi:transposase